MNSGADPGGKLWVIFSRQVSATVGANTGGGALRSHAVSNSTPRIHTRRLIANCRLYRFLAFDRTNGYKGGLRLSLYNAGSTETAFKRFTAEKVLDRLRALDARVRVA